jgi:hypothetical protein
MKLSRQNRIETCGGVASNALSTHDTLRDRGFLVDADRVTFAHKLTTSRCLADISYLRCAYPV